MKKVIKKVIKGITYISLMGTVTGKIPISPIINIVGILAFLKKITIKKITINKYIFPLFLLLLYCFLQTLFITPESLIKYAFYRYDGNLFPSYLPLLFFSIFAIRFNFRKIVKYYIYFVLSTMSIFLYIFNISPFKAHNALGGFLAEILLVIVAFLYVRKKVDIKFLVLLFICIVLIIKSDSRGSLLGVILSIIFVLFLPKFRWKFFILSLIILISIEIIYFLPYWKSLGEPISFFKYKEVQLNVEGFRWWTIVDRLFYLWPRAVDDWLNSPIFGIGFSKYNDIPYQLYGIKHLIMFNLSPSSYSDYHAHNSFLQFLAETGFIGLILLLIFIFKIEKFILTKLENPYEKYTLLLLLWYLVFASFTEHRFTTPSQAIPFSILTGIVISNYNFRKRFYK